MSHLGGLDTSGLLPGDVTAAVRSLRRRLEAAVADCLDPESESRADIAAMVGNLVLIEAVAEVVGRAVGVARSGLDPGLASAEPRLTLLVDPSDRARARTLGAGRIGTGDGTGDGTGHETGHGTGPTVEIEACLSRLDALAESLGALTAAQWAGEVPVPWGGSSSLLDVCRLAVGVVHAGLREVQDCVDH